MVPHKATSTKPIFTTKTIFIGNSGSSKSTLLNDLLGKDAFKADISFGGGTTLVPYNGKTTPTAAIPSLLDSVTSSFANKLHWKLPRH